MDTDKTPNLRPDEYLALLSLQALGPCTKLRLMSKGLTRKSIDTLIKRGILVPWVDPITQLSYFKVDNEIIESGRLPEVSDG